MNVDVRKSHEISHRYEFGLLCEWRRLYRAVEVGVDRGEFAERFMNSWPSGYTYWGIDPYASYREMPWGREADLQACVLRMQKHVDRFKLCVCDGETFLAGFGEGKNPIDTMVDRFEAEFIYIDGAHGYESVKRDLAMWWPRVSERGILAGHDWSDWLHPGVPRAVKEFFEGLGRTIYVTHDEPSPSWYVYKNEPGPDWKRFS